MILTKDMPLFFRKAHQIALKGGYKCQKIGAIAVYKGTILAHGSNSSKTSPIQKNYNQFRNFCRDSRTIDSIHAEIACLTKMRYLDIDFSKVELYTYRIRNDQEYGMARPCPSCFAYLKNMGVKKIHYTTNEGIATEFI